MKVIAFDIETHKPVPEGEDWLVHRPLGVANIAATIQHGKGIVEQIVFYNSNVGNVSERGDYPLDASKMLPDSPEAMTPEHVSQFVHWIFSYIQQGYLVTGWNSASFDWRVIADHVDQTVTNEVELVKSLAKNHIDMMFHFFCVAGYPLGLDTAAKGMGLPGKTEGMHGDLAPVMWAQTTDDRRKVLKYVIQDTYATLQVFNVITKLGSVRWTSRRGRAMQIEIGSWLPVNEALKLHLPDRSWMAKPKEKYDFIGWLS